MSNSEIPLHSLAVENAAPLVSVIIPCYKQAHFLGEAIESVLKQTYAPYEIIVVDDGSPDHTAQVATGYAGVRYFRQENQGLSAARNAGLRESRGPFLVFLDADDRLLPEALEIGVACLEERPGCAFVYGQSRFMTYDGDPLPRPLVKETEQQHYLELLQRNRIFCPASVMYRKSIFEGVGGFNTALKSAEDWDMYFRIAREHQVYGHPQEVAEYRQHREGMSRNSARMLKATIDVVRSQWRYVKGNEHYEEAYRKGIKHCQKVYGERLMKELTACAIKGGGYQRSINKLLAGFRYYPKGTLTMIGKRIQRKFITKES